MSHQGDGTVGGVGEKKGSGTSGDEENDTRTKTEKVFQQINLSASTIGKVSSKKVNLYE